MTTTTTNNFIEDNSRIALMFRAEELRADSGYYEPYTLRPYNPDIIVQKKGDFSTYDNMRRDDQIKSVLWLKKYMVLSTGWEIETKDEDSQGEIVTFLTKVLTDLNKPDFGDALIGMLTQLDYGFSITEPVFTFNEENKIYLKKLKTRAPHTFEFNTDKFGNLKNILQHTADEDITINPAKVIHMTHQSDFDNPYGTSDLQAAYRAWFSKDIMIRFWNIYLERFGNPHVIATVPGNLKQTDKNDLMDTLKNLQAKTGIRVPEGVDLKLLFPPSGNTDFERAIDKHNMMISRSMLIPDLIGIGGKAVSGGSFALGEKHFEMFFMTIEKDKKGLERAINRQIIQPLCLWNFGLKEEYPEWKLNEIADKDKKDLLALWVDAVKGKLWKPTDEEINHFRRKVKFPESDEIERVQEQAPVISQEGEDEEKEEDDDSKKKVKNMTFGREKQMIKLNRQKTSYEKKVNFERIVDDFDTLNNDAYDLLTPVFEKIKEGVLNTVESKKMVEKAKINQVNNFNLKYLKDLQIAFRQILRNTYKLGFESAAREIALKKMSGHLPALFEKTIEERSFYLTGIESEEIKKKVRQAILDGIDKGSTTQDVVFELEKIFDVYKRTQQAGIEILGHRLETIVRTNTIKAYNFGRRKMFESPDLDGFVKAYQFSAILDGRTTDLCNKLDGNKYKINDPYINQVTPSLHFNCRSLLIPIVEGEKFTESKKVDLDQYPNFGGTKKK